ncbi:centrosomal protein 20 isoform X3 [Antennarius striatus]|uniref:centrosomal protein 20 isoform X3 n=1 Tax=Antennarius striatus TaxID=241820 RepID=UPI0035AE1310
MATINELKCAIKDKLESRGVLGQLKARIRAEVFSALEDHKEPGPPLSHENLIINQLILEYLEFNNYRYAASVLSAGEGDRRHHSQWSVTNTAHHDCDMLQLEITMFLSAKSQANLKFLWTDSSWQMS